MNVRYTTLDYSSDDPCAVPLAGAQGELLTISIVAEPRDLENLLDRLGQSQFPIDPQIYHDANVEGHAATLVEFAAYDAWLPEIRQLLAGYGDGHEAVTIRRCLTHRAPN